jgi:hypothetical protein
MTKSPELTKQVEALLAHPWMGETFPPRYALQDWLDATDEELPQATTKLREVLTWATTYDDDEIAGLGEYWDADKHHCTCELCELTRQLLAQIDIYKIPPVFENERFLLRVVEPADAEDLLAVYADPAAQDILTECSAWNCDFGYGAKDLAAMQNYIGIWIDAYKNRFFVRMTILDKQSQKAVGTIEAFHRAEGSFCGNKICLRLDLHSDYENENAIDELLSLIIKDGIKLFGADGIVTRAIPVAAERIKALAKNGFVLSDEISVVDNQRGVTNRDFWVKTV